MKPLRLFHLAVSLLFICALAAHAEESRTLAGLEGLWKQTGSTLGVGIDGARQVDLGEGVRRLEWPDGRAEIDGLLVDGKPVTCNLDGHNELWHFDLKALAERLAGNTNGQNSLRTGIFDFKGDGRVTYTQYFPEGLGHQQSVLQFADGRRLQVASEHPLTVAQLENMAWVVLLAPRQTFASDGAMRQIIVSDRLGEVRETGGKFTQLGGLHDTSTGTIYIRSGELDKFEATAFILRHESGHALDAQFGWLSKSLRDADGGSLFGSGAVVLDNTGRVDLSKSAFRSEYAASNANEDFAETHEFLLWFREDYRAHHHGKDMFLLTADEFSRELTLWGISPKLQEKMAVIAFHVYGDSAAAIVPSGQDSPGRGAASLSKTSR